MTKLHLMGGTVCRSRKGQQRLLTPSDIPVERANKSSIRAVLLAAGRSVSAKARHATQTRLHSLRTWQGARASPSNDNLMICLQQYSAPVENMRMSLAVTVNDD